MCRILLAKALGRDAHRLAVHIVEPFLGGTAHRQRCYIRFGRRLRHNPYRHHISHPMPCHESLAAVIHQRQAVTQHCTVSTECLLPNKAHVGAPGSGPEQYHFIWFWLAALHAGGADWHAGHRKAGRIRLLGQKTFERGGWNVSFYDIARHFRRVAGREIVRDAEPCLHRIEVFRFQDLGRKSSFLQMLHPTQTAAAIRVPVDHYDRLRGRR